jgi:hypothetical protein
MFRKKYAITRTYFICLFVGINTCTIIDTGKNDRKNGLWRSAQHIQIAVYDYLFPKKQLCTFYSVQRFGNTHKHGAGGLSQITTCCVVCGTQRVIIQFTF